MNSPNEDELSLTVCVCVCVCVCVLRACVCSFGLKSLSSHNFVNSRVV